MRQGTKKIKLKEKELEATLHVKENQLMTKD
jgi:hypothetical protein